MAGFSGVVTLLSAVMLYIQQKSSEYLVTLNLKAAPFFHQILTIAAPPLPPPVTSHVTKTFFNTKTVTPATWSTVTQATTVYVQSVRPTAAYMASGSGHNIQDCGIVTSLSPWQLHHKMIIIFVMIWIPLCFVLTKVNSHSRTQRMYRFNEEVTQITEEYLARIQRSRAFWTRHAGPGYLEDIYAEIHAFVWRCHRKIDPYLQVLRDAFFSATDTMLAKIYEIGQILFEHLMNVLAIFFRALFKSLHWLICQIFWVSWMFFLFVFLPAVTMVGTYLFKAVTSPFKNRDVESLKTNIKARTKVQITRVKQTLASSPLFKKSKERARARAALVNSLPATPQQPNHFEVPYSAASSAGSVLVDSGRYEVLLQSAEKAESLARKVDIQSTLLEEVYAETFEAERREARAIHTSARRQTKIDELAESVRRAEARAAHAEAALQQEQARRQAAEEESARALLAYAGLKAENEELVSKVVDLQAALEKATKPDPVAEAPANQPAPEVQGLELETPVAATEGQEGLQEPAATMVPMGPGDSSEFAPGGFEDALAVPLLDDELMAKISAALAEVDLPIQGEAWAGEGGACSDAHLEQGLRGLTLADDHPMEVELSAALVQRDQDDAMEGLEQQPTHLVPPPGDDAMEGLAGIGSQPLPSTSFGLSLPVAGVEYPQWPQEMDFEMEKEKVKGPPGPVAAVGLGQNRVSRALPPPTRPAGANQQQSMAPRRVVRQPLPGLTLVMQSPASGSG